MLPDQITTVTYQKIRLIVGHSTRIPDSERFSYLAQLPFPILCLVNVIHRTTLLAKSVYFASPLC